MANQEHLDILEQGVETWNQWKKKHPAVRPVSFEGAYRKVEIEGAQEWKVETIQGKASNADSHKVYFTVADLSDANLSDVNLSDADLSGTDLSDAELSRANLSGANLNLANLSNANLSDTDLSGADLSDADLSDASCPQANLSGADLSDADLSDALLIIANLSNATLGGADLSDADLGEADLSDTDLRRADLSGTNLSKASLVRANLYAADLSNATLGGADLSDANLGEADLRGANLVRANLSSAELSRANLSGANLSLANLSDANLSDADLSQAIFVETDLSRTTLTRSSIYGISVWNVELKGAKQDSLIITPHDEPTITVDNLKVAQFIYLLLNNREIRDVIDTIGQKGVLILGRFSKERKLVLDALREKLRTLNFLPIVFDFESPTERDFTETILTLTGLSCFIIADITNPKSSPLELQATVPNYMIPFVPIIQKGEEPFSMFRDLIGKYNWVLNPLAYDTPSNLIKVLEKAVVKPALEKRKELFLKKMEQIQIMDIGDFL